METAVRLPFQKVILNRLKQRNNKHNVLTDLIGKYANLQERYDNLLLLRQNSTEDGVCNNNKRDSLPTEKLIEYHEEIMRLQKENQEKVKEINDIKSMLNDREKEMMISRERIASLVSQIEQMEGNKNIMIEELAARDRRISTLESDQRRFQEASCNTNTNHTPPSPGTSPPLRFSSSMESVGSVRVRVNIPTRVERRYSGHDIGSLAWSPSGKSFATAGMDKQLRLWQLRDGEFYNTFTTSDCASAVLSVDYHDQENVLLSASADGVCRLWSLKDFKIKHRLSGHDDKVSAAKFMATESDIVSGSHDNTLKLWDINRHVCSRTFHAGSRCLDLVYLRDMPTSSGTSVMSCHHDKMIRFWDVRSRYERWVYDMKLNESVTSLAVSPAAQLLLTCCKDTIKIADLRMLRFCAILADESFTSVGERSNAVFSPDGKFVLAGSKNGTLLVWGVESRKVVEKLRGHPNSVTSCAWHPDGKIILSSDKGKNIMLWSNHRYF